MFSRLLVGTESTLLPASRDLVLIQKNRSLLFLSLEYLVWSLEPWLLTTD